MSRARTVPSLTKSSRATPRSWERLASVLEAGLRDEAWNLALAEVLERFSPYQGEVVVRMASALAQAAPHVPRKWISDLAMLLGRLCATREAVRASLDALATLILRKDLRESALEDLALGASFSITTLDVRVVRANSASFNRLLEALEERGQRGVADHLRSWGGAPSLPRNAAQRFTWLSGLAWPEDRRLTLPSGKLALIDQSCVWTDESSGELLEVKTEASAARVRCNREAALFDFGGEPVRFTRPRKLNFTGALVAGDSTAFALIRSSEALIEQFTTGSWGAGALVASSKHNPLRLLRGAPPMVCVFEGQRVSTAIIGTTARGSVACLMLTLS
jgi:hypothetical protein